MLLKKLFIGVAGIVAGPSPGAHPGPMPTATVLTAATRPSRRGRRAARIYFSGWAGQGRSITSSGAGGSLRASGKLATIVGEDDLHAAIQHVSRPYLSLIAASPLQARCAHYRAGQVRTDPLPQNPPAQTNAVASASSATGALGTLAQAEQHHGKCDGRSLKGSLLVHGGAPKQAVTCYPASALRRPEPL